MTAVHPNWQRQGGKAGTYEVWYTTWNHPGTDQGYWLRFLIKAPVDGPPRGELWFARFDPRDPARTFGIHAHVPIDQVTASDAPFGITIADSHFGLDHSTGTLAGEGHTIRWDLRWQPAPAPLLMLPDLMYLRGGLGETSVLSPNPRVPLSGTLHLDGEVLSFDQAPAGQSHVWGTKHAYSWTWGHCADFAGADDAVLELLGARLHRRGVTLPPLTLVTLDLDGERHRFTQFRHVLGNRATWDTGLVQFRAWSPTVKLEGTLVCTPDQMVSCPYVDPDGQELTCVNTEIGDAHVTLYRRRGTTWRKERTLVGERRAHFEIGGRTRDPAVTRRHVLVGQ